MAIERQREPHDDQPGAARQTEESLAKRKSKSPKDMVQEASARCDQFIYLVSHELRGPLANLMGYSQLLLRSGLPEATKTRAAESLIRNAKRLNSMIETLLQASRVERGNVQLERKPVDILQLVERVVEEQRSYAPTRTVALNLPSDPIVGSWDYSLLALAIASVVSNALKFSAEDDRVVVDIRSRADRVEVAVTDFGIGISTAEIGGVFEPYRSRAGNLRAGLGVGLYVAKGLVEAHKGSISVTSVQGKGSTFVITLPLN